MDLSRLTKVSSDPGGFLKAELEEGLEPITKRVDALEKKLDTLILTANRIEDLLNGMKPITDLLIKLPIFK